MVEMQAELHESKSDFHGHCPSWQLGTNVQNIQIQRLPSRTAGFRFSTPNNATMNQAELPSFAHTVCSSATKTKKERESKRAVEMAPVTFKQLHC